MFRSIIDSTQQVTRVSFQVADIGSIKMKPCSMSCAPGSTASSILLIIR